MWPIRGSSAAAPVTSSEFILPMGHQPGVAAAAIAAIQGGHVGYVGDVNGEEGSGEIVLAMLQHSTA